MLSCSQLQKGLTKKIQKLSFKVSIAKCGLSRRRAADAPMGLAQAGAMVAQENVGSVKES
jgi:hypothetical protein